MVCRAGVVGQRIWALLLGVLIGAPGCGSQGPLEEAGVNLALPAAWRPVAASSVLVPGELLAAWKGPEGASLVVYRTIPIPGADPRALGTELANRLGNLPDCKVVDQSAVKIGDVRGVRVEVVGPGTGDALAASGMGTPNVPKGGTLVPTRRVSVAVPRGADTVWVDWHFSDEAKQRVTPLVEQILKGVQIQSRNSSFASSY